MIAATTPQPTGMVAGFGYRSGITAKQIEAALAAALQQHAPGGLSITLIAAPEAKSTEPALIAVAKARGVPLASVSQTALEAANSRTLTHSHRSMAAMNVHSVAEAAALAGAASVAPAGAASVPPANSNIQSRLLGPRVVVGPVTCALAVAQLQTTEIP
jgi:cobalt-precorrin 5A hydrolase